MEIFYMYVDHDATIHPITVRYVDDLFTRMLEESFANNTCNIMVETPRYTIIFSKDSGFKINGR